MISRTLLISAVILGLAACDAPVAAPSEGIELTRPEISPSAGPGSKDVSEKSGADIFRAACLNTRPSFRNTPAILAKMPFVQNSSTNTYYHKTLNLSVKLQGNQCSMVIAGKALEPRSVYNILQQSGAGKAGRFVRISEHGDLTYLRFVVGSI